eukprot:CAMPEP_0170409492 /NCGR_PEP_ID=MMETSP0117_2-20130122/29372_1 /TAXON_ID=400756 /ORGANISM="Durinskia baltica, Strain CSIRO CS-38" /LENGTH=102 /DNA_ID=CAMNT_0010666935 /DNA_START=347 /DNA_END=652 /DNA_ORIENTATION=-
MAETEKALYGVGAVELRLVLRLELAVQVGRTPPSRTKSGSRNIQIFAAAMDVLVSVTTSSDEKAWRIAVADFAAKVISTRTLRAPIADPGGARPKVNIVCFP